jgi:hypothetical protein
MAPARAEDAAPGAPAAPSAATSPPQATPQAPDAAQCVFERYVSVAAAAGFDPHLADEVRKDLAAELAPRGFGVCASQASHGELVAEVSLLQREPALVAIQVEDYTTGKRVARDVRLARIPAGGVALALAIAADELLRASWAELVLRRREAEAEASAAQAAIEAHAVSSEPPRAVSRQKRARVPAAVALAADYAHTSAGWDGFGLDLRLQLRPFHYGFLELGGGGVGALPVASELGTARAAGALALLTLGGCAEPEAHVVLCAGARGTFQWTRFRGSAAQDVTARSADLSSFVLSAVAQAQARVSPHFFLFGELALGGALVSALADSMQGTLIGIDGFVLGAALGAGYAP